ncbi:hypothetical protein J2Y55_001128 [Bosea sp. BE125]|uniref:hypothetical protein n=1 Tax=Bosea sp. BE125 TaxID=2817909 RepID=UPI002854D02F|nr:hypothetical protein [Bosea sp. BE125]MDR6870128.1 hypothetical protein [Bosea sp. BE125]
MTPEGKPNFASVENVRHFQGTLFNLTVKAVCGDCNNGWMSQREATVRPILGPLIKAQPLVLDEDSQRKLAAWVAMKIMVQEADNPVDMVSTFEDRTWVRDHLRPPPGWQIFIGQHSQAEWNTKWQRYASTLVTSDGNGEEFKDVETLAKNMQMITFGFGKLVVNAFSTKIIGLGIEYAAEHSLLFRQIWPWKGNLLWPTGRELSFAQIHKASVALRDFIAVNARSRSVDLPQ